MRPVCAIVPGHLFTNLSYDLVTGRIDSITTGPGGGTSIQNLLYVWDKVGNLTQRQDLRQTLTETFEYTDPVHRLTRSTLNGVQNLALTYTPLGNIDTKTEDGATLTYAYHATKKHALISAGTNTFAYDANGNANQRNGSTISWYAYNLPNTINAAGSNSSQFFYTPTRERWKQVASYGGTTETTIYVGGLIEKVTLGAVTSWKHYIAGGSGVAALYTRKSGAPDEMHYLTRDHLGNVDSVTNAAGAVEVRLSYEAFGQRRKEVGWSGNPTAADWTEITDTTRRGFTAHEMLDNVNLTHMNGRVYDQVVGRFISADPLIQAPGFTQSFNRYSYVFNSPVSFTDPSGFEGCCEFDRPDLNPQRYWGTSGGHNGRPGAPNREDRTDVRESRPGYDPPSTDPGTPNPTPRPPGPTRDLAAGPHIVSCPGDFLVCAEYRRPTLEEFGRHLEEHIAELEESLRQSEEMFARQAAARAAYEEATSPRAILAKLLDDTAVVLNVVDWATGTPGKLHFAGVGLRKSAERLASHTARVAKAVNLPAWKKVGIDTAHIIQRHTAGATLAADRTVFPSYMSERGVERAVRSAYRYGERIATQGDRVLVRGQAEGLTIEMWVNTSTKTIETAYPVF